MAKGIYRLFNLPLLLFIFLIHCSIGEKPPIAIWRTSSGKEYEIFTIGVWYSASHAKTYMVSFRLENPRDTLVCFKEFRDIYGYIVENIDLEGFTHVTLKARERNDALLGYLQTYAYWDTRPVDEVKELVSESTEYQY